jgi:hypothetical protein
MNWSEREEDMVVAGYRHIGVQTAYDSFLTHASLRTQVFTSIAKPC